MSETFCKYKIQNLSQKSKGTFVLIHGYLDNSELFNHFTKYLKDYCVVSINLPTNRESSDTQYDIEDLNRYVEEIFVGLDIQDIHLLGFSLGGLVATRVSRNKRVKSLTLVNSFPKLLQEKRRVLYRNNRTLLTTRLFTYSYTLLSNFKDKTREKSKKHFVLKNSYSIVGTLIKCLLYDGMEDFKDFRGEKKIYISDMDKKLSVQYIEYLNRDYQFPLIILKGFSHNFWDNDAQCEHLSKLISQ